MAKNKQSIPYSETHKITVEDLLSAYHRGCMDGSKSLMELYSRMELCVNLVHDIALICKEAKYPEDLEDIYDLLTNNGIDYKTLEDNNRWLKEHD